MPCVAAGRDGLHATTRSGPSTAWACGYSSLPAPWRKQGVRRNPGRRPGEWCQRRSSMGSRPCHHLDPGERRQLDRPCDTLAAAMPLPAAVLRSTQRSIAPCGRSAPCFWFSRRVRRRPASRRSMSANLVWNDVDADGIQDANEPGLGSVTVQLWNEARNQLLDSAVTSAAGVYLLQAPGPGNYRVRVGPADGRRRVLAQGRGPQRPDR